MTLPIAPPPSSRRARYIGLAAVLLCALAVSSMFAAGGAAGLDRWLILALRDAVNPGDPIGPGWFEDVMRDFTGLGGIGVVIGLNLACAGFLFLRKRYRDIGVLACSVVGAQLVSASIKFFVERARPDLVPHKAEIYSASFPSGHSLMATASYVTCAMLLAADFDDRRIRDYLLAVAWTVAFAVGCSRVYLGVHWPSDVLGGWTIGALWMLAMRSLWPRLRHVGAR